MTTIGHGITPTIRHSRKRSTFLPGRRALDELGFVMATVTLFGAVMAIGAMLSLTSLTSLMS